jgi:hypothetical protein
MLKTSKLEDLKNIFILFNRATETLTEITNRFGVSIENEG